ncbi:hypothetical protein FB451DRAFT_1465770 [Mycena latifolia]|nr:hypothetical protein FB451DRAFT_1465770 [Mycena latifolia]
MRISAMLYADGTVTHLDRICHRPGFPSVYSHRIRWRKEQARVLPGSAGRRFDRRTGGCIRIVTPNLDDTILFEFKVRELKIDGISLNVGCKMEVFLRNRWGGYSQGSAPCARNTKTWCLQKKVVKDTLPSPESTGALYLPGVITECSWMSAGMAWPRNRHFRVAHRFSWKTYFNIYCVFLCDFPLHGYDGGIELSTTCQSFRPPTDTSGAPGARPACPATCAISDKSSTLAECCGRRLRRRLYDVLLACARALQTASASAHAGGVVVRRADDQPRVGRAGGLPPGMRTMRREPLSRWWTRVRNCILPLPRSMRKARGEEWHLQEMQKDKQRVTAVSCAEPTLVDVPEGPRMLYGRVCQPRSTGRELATIRVAARLLGRMSRSLKRGSLHGGSEWRVHAPCTLSQDVEAAGSLCRCAGRGIDRFAVRRWEANKAPTANERPKLPVDACREDSAKSLWTRAKRSKRAVPHIVMGWRSKPRTRVIPADADTEQGGNGSGARTAGRRMARTTQHQHCALGPEAGSTPREVGERIETTGSRYGSALSKSESPHNLLKEPAAGGVDPPVTRTRTQASIGTRRIWGEAVRDCHIGITQRGMTRSCGRRPGWTRGSGTCAGNSAEKARETDARAAAMLQVLWMTRQLSLSRRRQSHARIVPYPLVIRRGVRLLFVRASLSPSHTDCTAHSAGAVVFVCRGRKGRGPQVARWDESESLVKVKAKAERRHLEDGHPLDFLESASFCGNLGLCLDPRRLTPPLDAVLYLGSRNPQQHSVERFSGSRRLSCRLSIALIPDCILCFIPIPSTSPPNPTDCAGPLSLTYTIERSVQFWTGSNSSAVDFPPRVNPWTILALARCLFGILQRGLVRSVTAAPSSSWNGMLHGNSHYLVRPVTSAPNSTVGHARSSALHVPVSPPVQHCALASSRPLTHSDASQVINIHASSLFLFPLFYLLPDRLNRHIKKSRCPQTPALPFARACNRRTLRASLSFYRTVVVGVSYLLCTRTLRLSTKVLSAPSFLSFMCDQRPGSI